MPDESLVGHTHVRLYQLQSHQKQNFNNMRWCTLWASGILDQIANDCSLWFGKEKSRRAAACWNSNLAKTGVIFLISSPDSSSSLLFFCGASRSLASSDSFWVWTFCRVRIIKLFSAASSTLLTNKESDRPENSGSQLGTNIIFCHCWPTFIYSYFSLFFSCVSLFLCVSSCVLCVECLFVNLHSSSQF